MANEGKSVEILADIMILLLDFNSRIWVATTCGPCLNHVDRPNPD